MIKNWNASPLYFNFGGCWTVDIKLTYYPFDSEGNVFEHTKIDRRTSEKCVCVVMTRLLSRVGACGRLLATCCYCVCVLPRTTTHYIRVYRLPLLRLSRVILVPVNPPAPLFTVLPHHVHRAAYAPFTSWILHFGSWCTTNSPVIYEIRAQLCAIAWTSCLLFQTFHVTEIKYLHIK